MTTSEKLRLWNESLANVISSDFGLTALRELITALENLAGGSSSTIIVYPDDKKPYVPYHRLLPAEDPEIHLDLYISGPYLVDPCYVHAAEVGEEGFFSISDLAPDGFEDSEYYRLYYHAVGLDDEACYIFRAAGGDWIVVSLGRHSDDSQFSSQEKALLQTLYPIVKAVTCRWLLTTQDVIPAQDIENHLNAALKNFGTSLLTPRESLILGLLLRGHSIKSVAQRLDNSLETIKHHRKNIYHKLDVSTQAELFHLFIDSLRSSALDTTSDPLTAYLSVSKQ